MPISKKKILTYSLCLLTLPAYAQLISGTGWGANAGIVAALGNRFQRIGLTLQGYYYHDFLQINAEVRAYHNFKNIGPPMQYNELVTSAGLVAGYGAKQTECNHFVSPVSNQTVYKSSVAYSYNLYFNRIRTMQQTGTIAFQFSEISIIAENDIFARPELDRFRTGAFLVQYQYKNLYQFAANCTMWTGQMGERMTATDNAPFRCYMDTTNGVYTNYSHGLLSGQFKTTLNYGQTLQANAGIDAEQVRNFVQNRLIHDMIFIPRKWHAKSKNCHIPMLDKDGQPYLYRPGQKIKSVKPYWNIFTSAATFY